MSPVDQRGAVGARATSEIDDRAAGREIIDERRNISAPGSGIGGPETVNIYAVEERALRRINDFSVRPILERGGDKMERDFSELIFGGATTYKTVN